MMGDFMLAQDDTPIHQREKGALERAPAWRRQTMKNDELEDVRRTKRDGQTSQQPFAIGCVEHGAQ